MENRLTKKYIDDLTYKIIGAAIEVHKELGPGLLEQVYETCFIHELSLRGINYANQQKVSVNYKGKHLDADLRFDVLVEDCIIVELKAVNEMHPIFEAQALTYAKLMKKPKAILINFTCDNIFKSGQKTFVTEYFKTLPQE